MKCTKEISLPRVWMNENIWSTARRELFHSEGNILSGSKVGGFIFFKKISFVEEAKVIPIIWNVKLRNLEQAILGNNHIEGTMPNRCLCFKFASS